MNKKLKGAMSIVERLRDRGFQAFFVGGYVRSMVMNRVEPDDDIDIATNAVPDQIKGMFRNVIGVGEHFGVVLVIINGISYEVATFRSDSGTYDGRHPQGVEFGSIEADAERRDFTVNSLYYDPVNRRVLDYTGGREDIQRGVLRAIGDPEQRFREDYLRLLRGIRFSARLSFRVEEKTYQAAKRNAAGIRSVSSERIFQEVTKILTGPDPGFGVRLLSETGLCRYVLPEVEKMKGIEQPPEFHPEGDVYEHTILCLDYMREFSEYGSLLAWSTLLHDIGKPDTMTVQDRIRFNNHGIHGAKKAAGILRRLKAQRRLIDGVYDVIENHMNFINVKQMRVSKLKRFVARETFEQELALHWIDCMASHGNTENYDFLLEKKQEYDREGLKPDPLIQGRDLISLGLQPGPLFGEILSAVYDLQLEGEIETQKEALDWVVKNYIGTSDKQSNL